MFRLKLILNVTFPIEVQFVAKKDLKFDVLTEVIQLEQPLFNVCFPTRKYQTKNLFFRFSYFISLDKSQRVIHFIKLFFIHFLFIENVFLFSFNQRNHTKNNALYEVVVFILLHTCLKLLSPFIHGEIENSVTFFYISECGKWTLSDSVTAKLTGEDVELSSDEKWQSLGYLLHLGDKTSCTVSIIGPRWIMTSHSCVSRYVFICFNLFYLFF